MEKQAKTKTQKSEKEIKDQKKKKQKQAQNKLIKQKYYDFYDDVKSFARDNGEW